MKAWLAILALVACIGCEPAATRLTTESAPWSYVDNAWGGLALAETTIAENQLSLTFRLRVHEPTTLDSAVCTCGLTSRVEAERILIRLDKCLCNGRAPAPVIAVLPTPAPGEYTVVYDDAAAGFPRIGRVTVP